MTKTIDLFLSEKRRKAQGWTLIQQHHQNQAFSFCHPQHFNFSSSSWRPHDCKVAASAISITFPPDYLQRQKQGHKGSQGVALYVSVFYQGKKHFSAYFFFCFIDQHLIKWLPVIIRKVNIWQEVDYISRTTTVHLSGLRTWQPKQNQSSVSAIWCAWWFTLKYFSISGMICMCAG